MITRLNPADVQVLRHEHEEEHIFLRDGIARALFVTAWADRQEELGVTYPGEDLMDVAPEHTPLIAVLAANYIVDQYEKLNKVSIMTLFCRGQVADLNLGSLSECTLEEEELDQFGHYLGMMAMGTGVSWFDDHADFPLESPFVEFSSFDLPEASTFVFEDRDPETYVDEEGVEHEYADVFVYAHLTPEEVAEEFYHWEKSEGMVYDIISPREARILARELREAGHKVDLSLATLDDESGEDD